MILGNTSAQITVTTSTAEGIGISVSFTELTSTTLVAFCDNTASVGAGSTVVLASPAASIQRQVKYLSFYNYGSGSNNLIIYHNDGLSATVVVYRITLQAGERVDYDGSKWTPFDANGVVKASQTAAGSNTQIQYNDNGLLGASADFTWDSTRDELGLNSVGSYVQLTDATTDPTTPASGKTRLWSRLLSGRSFPKYQGADGIDSVLQPAIFENNVVQWIPAAAAGVYLGTNGSNLGTPSIVLPTVTNLATMMRRSTFPSVVTTANQQVGIRTEAMFFRGNAAHLGGFFFVCRFMFATWTAGDRLFVGFTSGTTAVVTVQPSSLLNMLGFGIDAGDTAITFMHNDGAGTCTKDPIAGQPALATNQGYVAYIFCKPNDSTVYYRLDNVNLHTTIIDTSTSSDLPVNTTGLTAQCIMGNAANVVAGNATIGVNLMYIETHV